MLQQYKKEKEVILKKYDELLDMDIFPIQSYLGDEKPISKNDIKKKKENLEKETFFVSITGQIKAGKSTLLNALIFGKEIIPADVTPHTAKITLLQYSQTPKLEVVFYNKKEWENLKNDKYFSFIEEDVEESIMNGVSPFDVISDNALIKDDKIENLKEYVAKGGKYTPFVNLVNVYYPNEILKDIIIVDTPGVNDPNPIRDRVAKEWIKKTNANIYTIYAGQAFDEVDIDFIDKYLLSVPKNQKITVVNKIDTVSDLDSLKSWIQNLANDELLKNREVITNESDIVFVSGLGALLDKMNENDEEFDDNLEFMWDKLEEKGFVEEENHNLKLLEDKISQKLIQNKGINILNSHKQYISTLFDRKINFLQEQIELQNSHLTDISKTKDEINKNLLTLKQIQNKFSTEMERIENSINKLLKDETDNIHLKFTYLFNDAKKSVEKIIENYKEDDIENNNIEKIPWLIKENIEKRLDKIKYILKEIESEVKNNIETKLVSLKKEISRINKNEVNIDNFINKYLSVGSSKDIIDDIQRITENSLTKYIIRDIKEKHDGIFSINIGKIKTELIIEVKKVFDNLKSSIIEDLLSNLDRVLNNRINEINFIIKPFLDEKTNELRKIEEKFEEREQLRKEIEEKIDIFKNQLQKIEEIKQEVLKGLK